MSRVNLNSVGQNTPDLQLLKESFHSLSVNPPPQGTILLTTQEIVLHTAAVDKRESPLAWCTIVFLFACSFSLVTAVSASIEEFKAEGPNLTAENDAS